MDIEAYVTEHEGQWDRLATLVRGRQKLTGEEADEVVDLYQRTAGHLTQVRASAYDPQLEARLAALVTDARAVVTGASVPVWGAVGRFFAADLPAAFYRLRWAALLVGIVSVGLVTVFASRVLYEPGLAHSLMTEEQIKQLVEHDFEAYYSENPAADFALGVWVNNSIVTALAIATGILVLPALSLVVQNMINLGVIAGMMLSRGRGDLFFGLILPHGLLELTCIFFGLAAGLNLAWAWISPGPMTRSRAVGRAGRAGGAVAVGLTVALGVAGMLEAFVTPSLLPIPARVAIGALVWAAFLAYVLVLGRRAHLAGFTGDVTGDGEEQVDPTAAV